MERTIEEEIKIVLKVIKETVPVKRIYLFGSHGRAEGKEGDDLDICVVLPKGVELREIEAIKSIRKALRDKKTRALDLVVSKEEEFLERLAGPTMEREISEKGILLYEDTPSRS